MKRGVTPGKVVALASSLLLAGTYVALQAGLIRFPFFPSRSSARTLLSGSKSAAIGPALARHAEGAGSKPAASQPVTRPVFMSGSKYGVLEAWRLEQAGAEIPEKYWHDEDAAWKKGQSGDGGWEYTGGVPKGPTSKPFLDTTGFYRYTNGRESTVVPQTRPATAPANARSVPAPH